MTRSIIGALAATIVSAFPSSLQAQPSPSRQPSAPASRIAVCSMLPQSEVKKHLPWIAAFDRMVPKEEPIGVAGTSCKYASVFIQVLPFSKGTIDAARQKGGLENVRAVGDEAYFHDNADR